MASTAPARHVRQKPNLQDRPPQVIERTTQEGRRLRYELRVIQQPERARACGSGAKSSADRRPVDPPPVVELKIFEVDGPNQATDITFAYDANFFLFATLEMARPIAHGRVAPPAASQVPVLTGMPVSGMAYLDRPSEAGYFIFPDLSVRHEGKYRLSFNLYEETKQAKDADKEPAVDSKSKVASGQHEPEASFDWRMELKSDVFDVFSAKKFPGLAESTALSRTVAEQGCRVRIRRDVRMRRRGDGKGNDDFEDEINYERQSRAPTVDPFQRERSRSSSSGADGDSRQPYQHPGGNLSFGGQQYQAQQPSFAPPPGPVQQPQYAPQAYHHPPPAQYAHQAPPPPQAQHYGYERQYPQSAYPTNPSREIHREEDPWRRASVAGHPNEQFPRHHAVPEQTFNRNPQPFHGYAPRSPAQGNTLPPLQIHLAGKLDSSPAPLSSVRSIAPMFSPTYERREERSSLYPQHTAPLAPAPVSDAARNGKRSFDSTFGSASSKGPLYNGMRPSTPHDDGMYDDDDEASFIEEMKMNYKRADGSEYSRALPTLD